MTRILSVAALCIAAAMSLPVAAKAVPISRVVIDFNESLATRFVFDNLTTDTTTLSFTEVPLQPADGLTVNGITFNFTIGGSPSTDATYNRAGPGTTSYITGQALEGSTQGLLQLDFAVPTNLLSFGLAFNTASIGLGATIQLFDAALAPIGAPIAFNVGPVSTGFSEGLFSAANPVPEPATVALFALGLAALGWMGYRRRV